MYLFSNSYRCLTYRKKLLLSVSVLRWWYPCLISSVLQDAPLKYLSVTVFENCSVEMIRDFYMDNDFRKIWDKTLIEHKQLQVDSSSGTEIGLMIKKFPLLTPREYILAWRVWEGSDGSFYCFTKVVLNKVWHWVENKLS